MEPRSKFMTTAFFSHLSKNSGQHAYRDPKILFGISAYQLSISICREREREKEKEREREHTTINNIIHYWPAHPGVDQEPDQEVDQPPDQLVVRALLLQQHQGARRALLQRPPDVDHHQRHWD